MSKCCVLLVLFISGALNIFAQGKLLRRVVAKADSATSSYAEAWNTFYGDGYYKNLMQAELDRRPDNERTPNIVFDQASGKMTIVIRLFVNDEAYESWKLRTHKRFESSNLSYSFSPFEERKGRVIGGRNYCFGENEEAAIKRWEDAGNNRKSELTIRVRIVDADRKVLRETYVPLEKFRRLGFASYSTPLHNLNRLKDLPVKFFPWFDSSAKPSTDGNLEMAYASVSYKVSAAEQDAIDDVICEVLDSRDMTPIKAEWTRLKEEQRQRRLREETEERLRLAKEREERERKEKEEAERLLVEAEEKKVAGFKHLLSNLNEQNTPCATQLSKCVSEDMVSIKQNYYIERTEVPQRLWLAVMGNNPSLWRSLDNPVENVSWEDCESFLTKLNGICRDDKFLYTFRLLTVKEWDIYSDWMTSREGSHLAKTSVRLVGRGKANKYGLHDMYGNVWEWCEDPECTGIKRAIRGGSFADKGDEYKAFRSRYFKGKDCGLRLVLEIKEL